MMENKSSDDVLGNNSNYQLLCGYSNRVKGNKPMEYLLSKLKTREKLLEKRVFG
jgi:hypothetical protein